MTLTPLVGLLLRLLAVLGGAALLAFSTWYSVLVAAAVTASMLGLALATRRRKARSREKGASRHILIVSALTILTWTGIAMAFRVADSFDPETMAVSFAGDLTIGTIALVTVCTVGAIALLWSALASERSLRRKHPSPRRRARTGESSSVGDKQGGQPG